MHEICWLLSVQPRDVLCGVGDKVLTVLKNDRMKDWEKRRKVEVLLGGLADDRYARLVDLTGCRPGAIV